MADDLLDGLFHLRTGTPHFETGVCPGLLVDPGGALTQCRPRTVQRRIHCAKVGIGVRVGTRVAAMFAQVVSECLGRAIPAGGDPRATLPEAWARQVLARFADERAWRIVQFDLDTGGSGHANRLPMLDAQPLARLRQLDRDQLRPIALIPGSDQCPVDLQGT
ncbi:hypothetical protein D3C80_1293620 [compost metagenome]